MKPMKFYKISNNRWCYK